MSSGSIVPARIREARVARGYSLAELSEKIGVTSQAISQYELGHSTPQPEVMMRIIRELNFPLAFFRKEKKRDINFAETAVYYRGVKNIPKKLKDAYRYRIEWIDEIYSFLNRYIDFPKIDLPNLEEEFSQQMYEGLDNETLETIALSLRSYWGLGTNPIPNMVTLLQKKGFVIARIELQSKKIDAFSQWYNNIPYIILGSDKGAAVRSRFDLAHELAHLILHRNILNEDMDRKEVRERIEREADYFAGAFLMPLGGFDRQVVSSSVKHLLILKQEWKTSVSSMIKRSEQLHLFTDNQIRYLKSQMTNQRMWRKEPLDDELPCETPYMIKQGIKLLIDNNVLTPDSILEELAFDKQDIDTLCYLPNDLLRKDSNSIDLQLRVLKNT